MPDKVNEFLNATTVLTYGGASLAVLVVTNTFRKLTSIESPWLPFIVSMAIAFCGMLTASDPHKVLDYILSIINGCILFTSSAGIQEGVVHAATPKVAGAPKGFASKKIPLLSSWFKK
jgi:hypothetical protein